MPNMQDGYVIVAVVLWEALLLLLNAVKSGALSSAACSLIVVDGKHHKLAFIGLMGRTVFPTTVAGLHLYLTTICCTFQPLLLLLLPQVRRCTASSRLRPNSHEDSS